MPYNFKRIHCSALWTDVSTMHWTTVYEHLSAICLQLLWIELRISQLLMPARCLSEIKTSIWYWTLVQKTSIWYWTIENNCCQVRPHCQTLVWGCSHQHRRTQLLIKHKVQNTHTLSVAPAAVAPAERVRMILFENLRKQLLWNYSAKNKQTLCVCGTWHTAAETALIVISKSTWTITAYLLFKVFNISQKRLMSKYSVKTEKQQQLWFSDLEHTTLSTPFVRGGVEEGGGGGGGGGGGKRGEGGGGRGRGGGRKENMKGEGGEGGRAIWEM